MVTISIRVCRCPKPLSHASTANNQSTRRSSKTSNSHRNCSSSRWAKGRCRRAIAGVASCTLKCKGLCRCREVRTLPKLSNSNAKCPARACPSPLKPSVNSNRSRCTATRWANSSPSSPSRRQVAPTATSSNSRRSISRTTTFSVAEWSPRHASPGKPEDHPTHSSSTTCPSLAARTTPRARGRRHLPPSCSSSSRLPTGQPPARINSKTRRPNFKVNSRCHIACNSHLNSTSIAKMPAETPTLTSLPSTHIGRPAPTCHCSKTANRITISYEWEAGASDMKNLSIWIVYK